MSTKARALPRASEIVSISTRHLHGGTRSHNPFEHSRRFAQGLSIYPVYGCYKLPHCFPVGSRVFAVRMEIDLGEVRASANSGGAISHVYDQGAMNLRALHQTEIT